MLGSLFPYMKNCALSNTGLKNVVFSSKLSLDEMTMVSEEAISSVQNPLEFSVDYALEQLLIEPES